MGAATELLVRAVRERTADSPYRVVEKPYGFDVDLQVVDARWYSLMHAQGLSQAWTYQVRVDEDTKTISITDVVLSVSWKGGASVDGGVPTPTFTASASGAKGRFEHKSFRKTYAISERGTYEKVVDYSFDSAAGRRLIREPAREQGWQEKMGAAQRIGLVVGVAGALFALVVAVLLLVTLL